MSIEKLQSLFKESWLGYSEIIELQILKLNKYAYAIEIPVDRIDESWQLASNLLSDTGFKAIVSSTMGSEGYFSERLESTDVFSRFYFKEASSKEYDPESILHKSSVVDPDFFIEKFLIERHSEELSYQNFNEIIDNELDQSVLFRSLKPPKELIPNDIQTSTDLDKWLMNWELRNGGLGDREQGRISLYTPDNAFLLILPVASSWEMLAYVNWFGTSDPGAEYYIALGKRWEEDFGAELYCHYGTMLQCVVKNPPMNIESAWQLGRDHDLIAPDTFSRSGVSLRYYANGLVGNKKWFLHDRP